MKNSGLIFNIVLAIGLAVLYILHFTSNKNQPASGGPISLSTPATIGAQMVYINSDSLLGNYELYKKMKTELETKFKASEAEVNGKMRQLQTEVQAYQQKAATLTPELRAMNEENLGRKQQSLMQRREELSQQLVSEEQKMTEKIFSNISEFLKKYNDKGQYQFILGYQKGGGILYANEQLDITKQVIEGLNKEYNEQK